MANTSFAFTQNLQRLFIGAGLYTTGVLESGVLNLVNLATTGRLFLDLYMANNTYVATPDQLMDGVDTFAELNAITGLKLYDGLNYTAKPITAVAPTVDNTLNRVTFVPTPTSFSWTGLGAPTAGYSLRWLIVRATPSTPGGANFVVFAYDGGDVDGHNISAGGDITVSLPLVLAVNAQGV